MSESSNTIKQLIRNKRGQAVGILIATAIPGTVTYGVGWSRARNKVDAFDREFGTSIAMGRASKESSFREVPRSLQIPLIQFVDRCDRYFKGYILSPKQPFDSAVCIRKTETPST